MIAHGLADGNGIRLFTRVCQTTAGAGSAGILMARHIDLSVVYEAIGAGFRHVLRKPIDGEQLTAVLNEVFGPQCMDRLRMDGAAPACSAFRESIMTEPLPDLESIAALTTQSIREKLTTAELISLIRSVDYPFAGKERLEYFDRDTLERVVCLVRRWSQHRLEQLRSSFDRNEPQRASA